MVLASQINQTKLPNQRFLVKTLPLFLFGVIAGLNEEQVDTLWRCLAENPVCSDDCLSWFLHQAKSKDHHALGVDAFRHIFLDKVKYLETFSFISKKKKKKLFPEM